VNRLGSSKMLRKRTDINKSEWCLVLYIWF
jgi:hypothetical protein